MSRSASPNTYRGVYYTGNPLIRGKKGFLFPRMKTHFCACACLQILGIDFSGHFTLHVERLRFVFEINFMLEIMESRYRRSRNPDTNFTLRMFEEDYIEIGKLVSERPNEETGGNLFGLWTNYSNAVVLVATGPGQNCRRSATSFYQDIPYMSRVGELLTKQYFLCHIGEWHSHHQLQLHEPSGGDCGTIRRNYPRGSQGFVLMIANILRDGNVKLSPFKFVDDASPFERGSVEVLRTENPFNQVASIKRCINEGKEAFVRQDLVSWRQTRLEDSLPTQEVESRSRPNARQLPQVHSRSRSRSPQKETACRPQSRSFPYNRSHGKEDCSLNTNQVGVHKAAYSPQPPSQPKPERASRTNPRASRISASPPRPPQHPNNEDSTHRYSTVSSSQQWYEVRKDTLRETLRFIETLSDNSKVKITRDKSTQDLSMEFKHNNYRWVVTFPITFPTGTVTLENNSAVPHVSSISGLGRLDLVLYKLRETLQSSCMCRMCRYNISRI